MQHIVDATVKRIEFVIDTVALRPPPEMTKSVGSAIFSSMKTAIN